eukprot:scaffold416_cov329-Pavlova_lutheri.AAC.17
MIVEVNARREEWFEEEQGRDNKGMNGTQKKTLGMRSTRFTKGRIRGVEPYLRGWCSARQRLHQGRQSLRNRVGMDEIDVGGSDRSCVQPSNRTKKETPRSWVCGMHVVSSPSRLLHLGVTRRWCRMGMSLQPESNQ